jgi:hypothetical protein
VLQANFQLDSNPDGQDLERIASVTGLSKRVVQVWFQNSRARQKKHVHGSKNKSKICVMGRQIMNAQFFLFSFSVGYMCIQFLGRMIIAIMVGI